MSVRSRRTTPTAARFSGLSPVSSRASSAARAASKKRDTRCELLLRRAIWQLGLRYRVDVKALPGRPDIVFRRALVVVFVDGDFWHGRDLAARLKKLSAGHNAPYWLAKIRGNVERDRRHDAALRQAGWDVQRFWEGDVVRDAERIAAEVAAVVAIRSATSASNAR